MSKRTVSIYVTEDVLALAEQIAAERVWSRNTVLVQAVRIGLKALQQGEKPVTDEVQS